MQLLLSYPSLDCFVTKLLLHWLQILRLDDNQLHGQIPPELVSGLPRLSVLGLAGNTFSYASTPEEVKWLKHANEKARQAALDAGNAANEQAARQRREDNVIRRALKKQAKGGVDVMGRPFNGARHIEL